MKKTTAYLLLLWACSISLTAKAYNSIWTELDPYHVPSKEGPIMHPLKYSVYSLNVSYLRTQLFVLSSDPSQAQVIELPTPAGDFREFKVWEVPMMSETLGTKYPGIRTFTAEAIDDRRVTAKLDFTEYGFHAMVFDGHNTFLIDPYNRLNDGYYMCHYKRDEYKPFNERMVCMFHQDGEDEITPPPIRMEETPLPGLAARIATGYQLRTYRLALACSHQYAIAATGNATPSKAQTLSAMTTSMNRINGVYEREFSIHMNFVANEDTLIFVVAAGDPYGADNGNPSNLLTDNQTTCTSLIGSANYDFGHVFTTAGGGLSSLGCVCKNNSKAQSETGGSNPVGDGFDIDYVAHEMGHAFGANHTFNNGINGSCSNNNAHQATAYEPGSGSTIMAYAGICSPDDIQPHSDDYFHAASLQEIYNYSIIGTGNGCAVQTPTNNKPVGLANFSANYTIPYKTPFELVAPLAVDSVADTLTTYCWEEWNKGDFKKALNNTYFSGPIFRSFSPVESQTRICPRIDSVLKGSLSYVSVENKKGEKAPDTARFLTFKLTVRDIYNGNGCFLFPDDTIHLDAVSTGATNNYQGFKVTSPSTAVTWQGLSVQNITWNVVGTDAAPVSCDSVDIYLSVDGGYTWPYSLGRFVNNGSAAVTLPNPASTVTTSRIKVKGAGNVFFNVNGVNFTIAHATSVQQLALNDDIKVYPVPAGDQVHISTLIPHTFDLNISNTLGQQVWIGEMNDHADIRVASWAKGVYYIRFTDKTNGQQLTKQIVVK
jgi:hypothetical protein